MAAGLVISIEKNLNWLKCKKKKMEKEKYQARKQIEIKKKIYNLEYLLEEFPFPRYDEK